MRRIILSILSNLIFIGIIPIQAENLSSESDLEFKKGVSLYEAGQYKQAIKHFERCVELDHTVDIQTIRNDYSSLWLANCLYKIGQENKAKEYSDFYKALPLDRRQTTDIDSLYILGAKYFDEKDYLSASSYYCNCIGLIKGKFPTTPIFYSGIIEEYALVCEALHKPEDGIIQRSELAKIKRDYYGEYSHEYAISLAELASKESFVGKFEDAINHTKSSVIIYSHNNEIENKCLALCKLSNYQSFQGKYSEACNTILNVINQCNQEREPNIPLQIMALNDYADYLMKLGEISKGIEICDEALRLCDNNSESNGADYATTLNVKANLEQSRGNNKEAINLDEQALKIRQKLYGEIHPECALILNNLARYYMGLGQYGYCIELQKHVLEIYEKYYGEKDVNYATGLNNLADYYDKSGKTEQSLVIEQQALKLWEKMYGKFHPDYAMALTIIANYYYKTGNIEQAIISINEALNIKETIFGKNNPDYAISLNNLAYYKSIKGNYKFAIDSELKVLEILKNCVGESNPDYCMGLMILAEFYDKEGIKDSTLSCLNNALELYASSIGEGNAAYAYCLSRLAKVYSDLKNTKKTEEYAEITTRKYKEIVLDNFRFLTSHERQQLWGLYEKWFADILPSIANQLRSNKIMTTLYDSELLRKGLLLNAEMALRELLEQSGNKEMLATFDALSELKARYQKQQEQNIIDKAQQDSVSNSIKELEKQLIDGSKTYGDYTNNLTNSWIDVKNSLKANEIAVEFIRIADIDSTYMYSVMVLEKQSDYPKYIPLISETKLKALNKKDKYTLGWEENLYKYLIEPIIKAYPEAISVYFSPAGEIHNIPIENICTAYGKQSIRLFRLSSTRQLIKRHNSTERQNATLFGGIAYNSEVANATHVTQNMITRGYEDTDLINDSLLLRNNGYDDLPGTEIEVNNINNILSKDSINTNLYTHDKANELSFKLMSGKQVNILHVATHGFYWSEQYAKRKKTSNALLPILADGNSEDESLTRSGLILAGANSVLRDKKRIQGKEDGILTAREIANLDLRDVDIVVLSACQTGLGEISGEGVFGLQRGFKKAGVHSIVMSLWSVSDEATRLLMEEFYRNLVKGESQQMALSNAQKYLRDSYSKYSSPFYWAAFVILDSV